MKFEIKTSYNFDKICFLNCLTGNEYYLKYYKKEYDIFYPLLDKKSKTLFTKGMEMCGKTTISPLVTLYISSMKDFNKRDLEELINNEQEMKSSFRKHIYYDANEWQDNYTFIKATLPIIKDLERVNFKEYWLTNRLPLIKAKKTELNSYLLNFDLGELISSFVEFKEDICTVYLCSFARPHGIKLCGPSFISDYSYKKESTISIAAHEMFHPPYNYEHVKDYVDILAKNDLIVEAFKNQNPNSGYYTLDDFIEENIVEALGVYVCYMLNIEKEPYEYFEKHDEGSHVLSPHFFNYLLNNPKSNNINFDEYFIEFVKRFTGV
ncbi:hypothetical protein IMX26_03800 [Clostridium sp. 'deep sea']|uniref:hypothetical protein n=1 Tax=Clostridium sp. 'deep sea' TaxID=2779445 RepID=UPI0018964F21|nr:hypothetical protein [Clostridium sp. 'deep sea']QOR35955.1 hypothetical protein IMX26_03800 [Clostridium sp. 'deep sea']